MTLAQRIITIAVVTAVTVLTRMIAFWLFPEEKTLPPFVSYLGKVLPPAVFGMLVIYCLKDVSLFSQTHAIPELLAIAVVVLVHFWKKNMFLSIASGTIGYMIFIKFLI